MTEPGFLAIFSDVVPEDESDYVAWLTREHAAERLSVPGFRRVRVFRTSLGGMRRFFILYDLASSEVLRSPAYRARLDAPTEWSRRIMPRLRNFKRGGGGRIAKAGLGEGMIVAPIPTDATGAHEANQAAGEIAAEPGVLSVQLLAVDRAGTDAPTGERALRGGDGSFAGLALVESLEADDLTGVVRRRSPGGAAELFSAFFALDRSSVEDATALGRTKIGP